MKFSTQVKPISYLKSHAAEIVKEITETREPMLITQYGEAKLVVGLQARVWLEDGSKDSAAKVAYTGVVKESRTQAMGKVVGVAKDGKSFTVVSHSRDRGEEPKKTEVKIGDKTAVTYGGVGPNGATPTKGYGAQVTLEKGKDVAASVHFQAVGSFDISELWSQFFDDAAIISIAAGGCR